MTGIAIYDPRRLSEKDFLAGFIARQDQVDFLLHQLRLAAADGEARHRVIVGPRGMGKTSLLRRLAIGIPRDPDLAETLLPLTFREEQYNVRTLARFWRNCGEALAEWLEQSGDAAGAARLDRELETPAWQEADSAADAFQARIAETGRRPVLFVDNLDLVLDALPEEEHWQLRRALQASNGPIVYGAATQAPRQGGDPRAAFYEFFRIDVLEPLSEAELLRCMHRLAAVRGEAGRPVAAILEKEPQRLRVLHTLTGGNPRVLALIYQLLERAESETVFADLEALLDQLTPLYKARVEELRTELQRSILDAIALHWDPITSHDLSVATGVEITTVSSQLSRLKNFGLVEEVPTSGARAGYQLVERFFNVWYLMRHGTRRTRQKMRWLTAFLQTFYTGEDLKRMRERFGQDTASGKWHLLYAEALDAAVDAAEKGIARARSRRGFAEEDHGPSVPDREPEDNTSRTSLRQLLLSAVEHLKARRDDEAEKAFREALGLHPENVTAWSGLGILLADAPGRRVEAEEAWQKAIRLAPKPAWAWRSLGELLAKSPERHAEAEVAFREAIRLDPENPRVWCSLGDLLTESPNRYAEAEEAFQEAIKLEPKRAQSWGGLGLLLAHHPGRYSEAEEACRKAIGLDPNNLSVWCSLGILLADTPGRHAEAEKAFREAVKLAPEEAWIWECLGKLLADHLQRPKDAEHAYLQAIKVHVDTATSTLCNLLWLYLDAERIDEARILRQEISGADPVGLYLVDAAFELAQSNFGTATRYLDAALGSELTGSDISYFDDLFRLLRLFERHGYGDRLIAWFEETGHADRYAPAYAAFVAYVRGERMLLDVSPEVRQPAERIHAWLASRRHASEAPPERAPKRRRGRPPKRLGTGR